MMSGLHRLVDRYDCSTLGVRHLTKDGKTIRGSVEILAGGRSSIFVGLDHNGVRVAAHDKSNLAARGDSWFFDIAERAIQIGDERVKQGRVEWLGVSPMRAEDLKAKKREQPRRIEAGEFLEQELADGPRRVEELIREAGAVGVSKRSLERAKSALGVKSRRRGAAGSKGYWTWSLAE